MTGKMLGGSLERELMVRRTAQRCFSAFTGDVRSDMVAKRTASSNVGHNINDVVSVNRLINELIAPLERKDDVRSVNRIN